MLGSLRKEINTACSFNGKNELGIEPGTHVNKKPTYTMHPTKQQVKYKQKLKEDILFKTEVSHYQDCLALISH